MSRILLILFLCGGCITQQGHFALIDIDFRKPDQIRESVKELEIVYGYKSMENIEKEDGITAKAVPMGFWATLFNALCTIEGRVTLLQYRWSNDRNNINN